MKPESKREKGARFERMVAKEIKAEGLGEAGREGNSGAGFRKGDIASNLPFLLECKNEEQTNFLPNIDQAKSQAEKGNWRKDMWALITRDPRCPEFEKVYATIDFWEFLKLLKKNSEPMIQEPDRAMKFDLERLKTLCLRIGKRLE
jgi:hypothetical protein